LQSSEKEGAIELYLAWHRINGAHFLKSDGERARREIEKRLEKIEAQKTPAIQKHKEFIRNLSI
jgi:hypothetical protein